MEITVCHLLVVCPSDRGSQDALNEREDHRQSDVYVRR